MSYVIRTEALGKPHWFAGSVESPFGPSVVMSPLIFNAWGFETEEEAQNLVDAVLGNVWSVAFVSDVSASQNLQHAIDDDERAAKPTFDDDLEIIAVRDEYGRCWEKRDNIRGGKLERSSIIGLMRQAISAREKARRAWVRLYGGKREQKQLAEYVAARIKLGNEAADWETAA